jgi:hypothetical protein
LTLDREGEELDMAGRKRQRDTDPVNRICFHCVYLMQPEPLDSYRDILSTRVTFPLCAHHAQSPGVVREVHPAETCRHFRARRRPAERPHPIQPRDSDIRYIPLTKRQVAIVDAADYEWLSQYRWFAKGGPDKYYAGRTEKGRSIMMHREIMKPPPGMVVDHINGNSLDNRRRNMRNCTPQQNTHNRRFTGNASGFAGVYPQGKRWRAVLHENGQVVYCALFDDKVEAAKARDRQARQRFGPFACLNFPDEQHAPESGPRAPHRRK